MHIRMLCHLSFAPVLKNGTNIMKKAIRRPYHRLQSFNIISLRICMEVFLFFCAKLDHSTARVNQRSYHTRHIIIRGNNSSSYDRHIHRPIIHRQFDSGNINGDSETYRCILKDIRWTYTLTSN